MRLEIPLSMTEYSDTKSDGLSIATSLRKSADTLNLQTLHQLTDGIWLNTSHPCQRSTIPLYKTILLSNE
jgi:hypothetical protein